MAIPVVTENWSDRQFERATSAQRGWLVTGVNDENEAIAAVPEAQPLTSFVLDGRLFAGQPLCTREKGPRAFHVVSRYGRSQLSETTPNPLDQPLRYSWNPGSRSGRTDIDAKRRPLLNAAGVPIPGVEREQAIQVFTISRNESKFDAQKAVAYCGEGGSINKDNVQIRNIGTLFPGQMLIRSYRPTTDWDERSQYVNCAYSFELLKGSVQDKDGLWDGFKYRLPNVSFQGWAVDKADNKAKLGRFVNSYGEPFSEPVPIDGSGVPYSSDVFVALAQYAKLNPVATPKDRLLDLKLLEFTDAFMIYLKYSKFPEMPFSGLNLF